LEANPQNNPSRFTGKEAHHTLDEVRRRYGIHQPGPQHPRAKTSSSPLKEPAKHQPRTRVRLGPPIPMTPLDPLKRMQLDPLVHGVNNRHCEARHPSIPTSGSLSDNHSFHYLIRIAECALPLHCEVIAHSDAAARHQVKQIPNLMKWREISGEELAEILKNERALSRAVNQRVAQPPVQHCDFAHKQEGTPNSGA
jgi:hypothetical protein